MSPISTSSSLPTEDCAAGIVSFAEALQECPTLVAEGIVLVLPFHSK